MMEFKDLPPLRQAPPEIAALTSSGRPHRPDGPEPAPRPVKTPRREPRGRSSAGRSFVVPAERPSPEDCPSPPAPTRDGERGTFASPARPNPAAMTGDGTSPARISHCAIAKRAGIRVVAPLPVRRDARRCRPLPGPQDTDCNRWPVPDAPSDHRRPIRTRRPRPAPAIRPRARNAPPDDNRSAASGSVIKGKAGSPADIAGPAFHDVRGLRRKGATARHPPLPDTTTRRTRELQGTDRR